MSATEQYVIAKRRDAGGYGEKGRPIELELNAFEVEKFLDLKVQHC